MTKQAENVALIDMDGTVADYDVAMREGLEAIRNPVEPEIPEDIHNGPDWLQRRIRLVRKQPGFWRDLPPIQLGFDVVGILRDEFEYNLTVLTKGPSTTTPAWTEKRDWCHKHLPGVPVTMTEDKGLIYGKVLFDDFPPYVLRWLEWRPRGLVIMLKHPWNRDFEHPNVIKIGSPEDFPALRDRLQAR